MAIELDKSNFEYSSLTSELNQARTIIQTLTEKNDDLQRIINKSMADHFRSILSQSEPVSALLSTIQKDLEQSLSIVTTKLKNPESCACLHQKAIFSSIDSFLTGESRLVEQRMVFSRELEDIRLRSDSEILRLKMKIEQLKSKLNECSSYKIALDAAEKQIQMKDEIIMSHREIIESLKKQLGLKNMKLVEFEETLKKIHKSTHIFSPISSK